MEASPTLRLQDCWAKSDPVTGLPGLSVRDHCLIVGHIANALASEIPKPVRHLLPHGFASLIAAHDLGKITPGFQLKCPLWEFHESCRRLTHLNGLITLHAAVSQSHLQFSPIHSLHPLARLWLISTAGHHGGYPDGLKRATAPAFEGGNPDFIPLREELVQILIETFGPFPTESAKNQPERIHLLTGFTIFSDWLGSNTDWFPFDFPVEEGAIASRIRELTKALGLHSSPRPGITFESQFHTDGLPPLAPRPLQSTLVDAADQAGLYIVEAPMGMGKTEAALAAAYRRWTEGTERGLYFALPTQLSSERIHDRITSFLKNVLGEEATHSLVHGHAWLHGARNRRLSARVDEFDHNDTDEALRWFNSTRRQLLAPFGTGTIDQALLAILPARFAALRYFALAGKVVVVDEVHSYDPYISALIDRLIRYLLKAGSTIIILSATLTSERRFQLIAAARKALDQEPRYEGISQSALLQAPDEVPYPLITKITADATQAIPIIFPESSEPHSNRVHLVHQSLTQENESAYWKKIASWVELGANVVVIRNTVALAQETYRHLKSLLSDRIPEAHCGLLHSRFPIWQRSRNESRWVSLLGKDSSLRPPGSLLVSTQIVEQSVDIDADLLITDLAPTELILQRIGRLHRHPHPRPPGMDKTTCHILYPPVDWENGKEALTKSLAPHHYIYPAFRLWQASTTLHPMDSISLPSQVRTTLERSAAQLPEVGASDTLHTFHHELQTASDLQNGTAATRDVFSASALKDQEGHETRFNIQPSAQLVLLKRPPMESSTVITVHPLHGSSITFPKGFFSYDLATAIHLNAIRIPAHWVHASLRAAPEWLQQHMDDGVIAVLHDSSIEVLPVSPSNRSLRYTSFLGLTQQQIESSPFTTDLEDYWF
ncbi:CRISPR-associated endonuclease/helicase Cas3 [Haloferula luteola]|uniref:CRISPR-associated endonuclease/helicase Cas3 n=1 Tax=Haloferula luteola TaxID=595692 RepID=A0A840VAX9_9BACT|nr:CRISPR-associated endonuclease/helicase Cas3 [Haloferula luteola]